MREEGDTGGNVGSEMWGWSPAPVVRRQQSRGRGGERGSNRAEERWEEQNGGTKASFKTGKSLLTEILSFFTGKVWFWFVFSSSKHLRAPAAESKKPPRVQLWAEVPAGPGSLFYQAGLLALQPVHILPTGSARSLGQQELASVPCGVEKAARKGKGREEHPRARARAGSARNRAWLCPHGLHTKQVWLHVPQQKPPLLGFT